MQKLLYYWNGLKSTFWFVPILIMILSIVLALLGVYVDSQVQNDHDGWLKYILTDHAASARSILTTIAGAMIGVAGTVFSITLVALTLASSQFGPRLIRNFMYVRINQVVLGTYIATFIYCIIVLNMINDGLDPPFIPSISILIAQIAAIANIVLLIIFIHHIAISIQADYVIADISSSLTKNIKTLFPQQIGENEEEDQMVDEESLKLHFQDRLPLTLMKDGYLRYINNESLLNFSEKHKLLVEINVRPGDFIVKGMKVGAVYINKRLSEEQFSQVAEFFILGKTRTQQQDAEYSIHQLVEIASRALSPGVNDPYTAIACIDNLTATMAYLSTVKFPSRHRHDSHGNLRIIADAITYEGMMNASFNSIRQYGKGNPSVIIRLMEALGVLYGNAKRKSHKESIEKHVKMILAQAESNFEETNDLNDLKTRCKEILGDQVDLE